MIFRPNSNDNNNQSVTLVEIATLVRHNFCDSNTSISLSVTILAIATLIFACTSQLLRKKYINFFLRHIVVSTVNMSVTCSDSSTHVCHSAIVTDWTLLSVRHTTIVNIELEPECLSHCYRYSVLSLRGRRYVTIATIVRKFVTEILKSAKKFTSVLGVCELSRWSLVPACPVSSLPWTPSWHTRPMLTSGCTWSLIACSEVSASPLPSLPWHTRLWFSSGCVRAIISCPTVPTSTVSSPSCRNRPWFFTRCLPWIISLPQSLFIPLLPGVGHKTLLSTGWYEAMNWCSVWSTTILRNVPWIQQQSRLENGKNTLRTDYS